MCCNNTWPIIVTHLTHRDVDHWWQSPLQSTFLCLCTHLLQRCLGVFLSMRLGGEHPGCLPYMLRSRCSFAWKGSSFCRRNTSHGFSQYMFADIMFNTTSSIFINKPVRGTWFCCSWMKEILDTKPCPWKPPPTISSRSPVKRIAPNALRCCKTWSKFLESDLSISVMVSSQQVWNFQRIEEIDEMMREPNSKDTAFPIELKSTSRAWTATSSLP